MVVDCSVATKWFYPEVGHVEARRLQVSGQKFIAPDLLVVELANVAWKKHRTGDTPLRPADAAAKIAKLIDEFVEVQSLAPRAGEIAEALDHPVYDCIYLALAETRWTVVVSADARFQRRVQGTSWAPLMRPLIP